MTDILDTCPACGRPWPNREPDGRAKEWRVRIRLYAKTNMDEPEADTDPDLAPDAPGTLLLAGLPQVANELARTAEAFHGTVSGLGEQTLLHRLKSLRPTLSRRGGDAVWRVPYQVTTREGDFTGESRVTEWLARVDIQRETK